jgi:sulfoxide reductase heme-binding subunit YedZ
MQMNNRNIVILKVLVWLACLEPVALLLYRFATHDLGANPIEAVTLDTGQSILVFLLITLAITPLRKITGLNWLIRFRRLFGLFTFFYAVLHFSIYVVLDRFFDLADIIKDVTKRPFITVGFLGFVLMIPLAVTSTSWAIRKMGGRRWNLLHRLIYIGAIAGIVHFWWKVKADHTEPAMYGAILLVLLVYRLVMWARKRMPQPSATKERAALASE